MARPSATQRVLDGLARMVVELSSAADLDAGLLEQRAGVLANALRVLDDASATGTDTTAPTAAAAAAAEAAATAIETTTERGAARAGELLAVLRKEIEEKGGPPPEGQPGPAGGGAVGPTRTDDEPGGLSGAPPVPGGDRPPPGAPGVAVGEPRVRRCYRFTLTNRTSRVVSDLTFDTPGGQPSISAKPNGWTGMSGPDGFRFEAGEPAARVAPGRRLGPFEFCREGEAPLRGRVALSHPDGGPNTPLGGEDIDVRGKRPATDAEGNVVIPATQRQYVHDVTVDAGRGGQNLINVDVTGARVRLDGDEAVSENGTASAADRQITIGPRDRTDFEPGTRVVVRVVADRPISGAAVRR